MAEESEPYRGPTPEPWGMADMERESAIGPEAREDADRLWSEAAPRALRSALDAPGDGPGPGDGSDG